MLSLLNSNPGLDPNRACNPGNDRPLHIVLRIIEPVTLDTASAIFTLIVDTNANLQASNNSNETPASLLEVRYDRLRIRLGKDIDELCQKIKQAAVDRYNSVFDRYHEAEGRLYLNMRKRMGESFITVGQRLARDFYGNPQGFVNIQKTCEYRRSNRYSL